VIRSIAVALACLGVGACADDSGRAGLPVVSVDPYGEDPFLDAGSRDAVCRDGAAADRVGRAALAAHIAEAWPDVTSVLGYECREINLPTGSYPDCDGEVEPDRSTCWSTHASGRAIDVVVGGELNEPTPDGIALGDRIATAFLAEKDGVAHFLARVTGVEQILWNDRCWTTADRDVLAAAEMARCGIPNHDNHVHLTLSNAGADGLTSWYAATNDEV
jgi:hypothetical protein